MSNYNVYIGIDNGVSGSIGILDNICSPVYIQMPTFKEQNYTKAKGIISRINTVGLTSILEPYKGNNVKVLLERPMVNPGRFKATTSALRALEATLIVIESMEFSYEYVDSKEWQKLLLPKGTKGPALLKQASTDIGKRIFPNVSHMIDKQKDADGILIAEYARRTR